MPHDQQSASVAKVFCHINEFRDDGWELIPAMMLLADEIVLWSPSGIYLKKLHEEGKSPFGIREVLTLVDKGVIKIAGRREWITNQNSNPRKSPWQGAGWYPDFDNVIKRMYLEDSRSNVINPRVLGLEEERGYYWADQQLESGSPASQIARDLFRSGRVPVATAERIEKLDVSSPKESEWAAARVILRDARNHEDARDAVGANLALQMAPFPTADFNKIVDVEGIPANQNIIDRTQTHELFKWLGSLKYSGDIDAILKMREDRSHREHIWSMLTSNRHPFVELIERMEHGTFNGGILEETYGTIPLQVMGGGGLAVAAVSAIMSRRWFCIGGALSAAGLAFGIAPVVHTELRRESFIADDNYSGPMFPFLLASGGSSPTRDDVAAMVESIKYQLGKE